MKTKGKKKQLDFTVKPRAGKEALPPAAEQWIKEGQGTTADLPMKRLTHNIPADLHTRFKTRCVLKGVTIQDRVQLLIERDLADDQPALPSSSEARPLSD